MAGMSMAEPMIVGVELGGTKCIATLAQGRTILRQQRWPTGTADTLTLISDTIALWERETCLAAIGVASFGPLHLNPHASHFGHMGNTPKPGWAGVDIYGHFASRFAMPIAIDTDVAGAALAEGMWGAAQGCAVHAYATIGTGVGLGLVVNGQAVHGHLHPEAGHMRVRRQPGDMFAGVCPSHGDCLEGLVGGPALAARSPIAAADMTDDDPLWQTVAADLAEWTTMLILALSPQRLVLGGGVIQARPMLLPLIARQSADLLNRYIADLDYGALEQLIVAPGLGADAGPLGAISLGQRAAALP
ncbi:ROK family protein [Sphingobium sp. Z007]|uniref:ROK family protein n=1 Tax=Sphingobium sp. Z007 TaxID=627495 RepID=UPI000B4A409D|nr:ROK family protein [Sphingobium sp. Z007]